MKMSDTELQEAVGALRIHLGLPADFSNESQAQFLDKMYSALDTRKTTSRRKTQTRKTDPESLWFSNPEAAHLTQQAQYAPTEQTLFVRVNFVAWSALQQLHVVEFMDRYTFAPDTVDVAKAEDIYTLSLFGNMELCFAQAGEGLKYITIEPPLGMSTV